MHDCIIIGLGIVGAACARELARYDISILALEAGSDMATGATRANSGIVHAGYDAKPGTKKAYYNVKGNALYDRWAKELDFPFIRNGSLIVAHSDDDLPALEELKERGEKNGVEQLRILDYEELHALEPNLSQNCRMALLAGTGGITSPYEFCFACGENAAKNGVQLRFNSAVTAIRKTPEGFTVTAGGEEFTCRAIVNAAGLYSDDIHNMLCPGKLTIHPRRGEYRLMDSAAGSYFTRTVFTLPTKMGKGILISPTVDGNLYLGPTAVDSDDKTDRSTTASGMDEILMGAQKSWSELPKNRFITGFTGLRAHIDSGDVVIGAAEDVPGLFDAAGVESPGLTAAPAIAADMALWVADYLKAQKKADFDPIRKAIPCLRTMNDEQKRQAIAADPRFAHIICRCEQVSEAEIVMAIERGATTVDGVKRRTRSGMGKCQGGFCGPSVTAILARELGIDPTRVEKDQPGSYILSGRIR
ncbi:MAG: NAD(P)/FAD-dependent oxidoreductase [Christensenellaceae bacterium]|nr:NAD(P)/FAD-dependent oxidoreductase [Christensenellaceae bacterium]